MSSSGSREDLLPFCLIHTISQSLERCPGLRDGIKVIVEAIDGSEAVTQALDVIPDIILMDIIMPNCTGLQAIREIRYRLPDTRIIMLTVSDTDAELFEAIRTGVDEYLLKDVHEQVLPSLLQRTAEGEALLNGLLAAKILDEFCRQGEKESTARSNLLQLSDRNQEVLKLVAGDSSNREISERLVLSENTVNTISATSCRNCTLITASSGLFMQLKASNHRSETCPCAGERMIDISNP